MLQRFYFGTCCVWLMELDAGFITLISHKDIRREEAAGCLGVLSRSRLGSTPWGDLDP